MDEALRPACIAANGVAAPCELVSLSTSARLHFGFLNPSGRGPRPFGSFGLAIDRPRTRLTLRRGLEFKVTGVECERAAPYLRAIAASFGLSAPYHLHLDEVIPAHAGLGSGTQLALAIGSAVAMLEGLPLNLTEIAARLDRGKRSGIGIGTFEQGGAVLDGGPSNGALPEVLWRVPFPSEWRALLDLRSGGDRRAWRARDGGLRRRCRIFREAKPPHLTRRILQAALPALAAEDFKIFCDEVGHLQKAMGAYFAPIQGGAYVSAGVAAVLKGLASDGVTGLGQSSWGPTGFAFAASEAEGQALLAVARAHAGNARLEIRAGARPQRACYLRDAVVPVS